MTSTATVFQVVDAPASAGVSAPSTAAAASAGSFGAFLSALVNATDEISNFYSEYMIAQAKITDDQSSASIANSKAQVIATNKQIQEDKDYEAKLHKASFFGGLIRIFSIIAAVITIAVIIATNPELSFGLAFAILSLVSSLLPAQDNPFMLLGDQIGELFHDKNAGQWIGLGLQVSASFISVAAALRSAATEATTVAETLSEKFMTAFPSILTGLKGTAMGLDIASAATQTAEASYTLEAAEIMKNHIAPLEGKIALFTAFGELIKTQQEQQSESQTSMNSAFSELFKEQNQLAEMYGAAYKAGV